MESSLPLSSLPLADQVLIHAPAGLFRVLGNRLEEIRWKGGPGLRTMAPRPDGSGGYEADFWVVATNAVLLIQGEATDSIHPILARYALPATIAARGGEPVLAFAEDPAGRLWLGTRDGALVADPVKGPFHPVDRAAGSPEAGAGTRAGTVALNGTESGPSAEFDPAGGLRWPPRSDDPRRKFLGWLGGQACFLGADNAIHVDSGGSVVVPEALLEEAVDEWLRDLEFRDLLWTSITNWPGIVGAFRATHPEADDSTIMDWEVLDTLLDRVRPHLTRDWMQQALLRHRGEQALRDLELRDGLWEHVRKEWPGLADAIRMEAIGRANPEAEIGNWELKDTLLGRLQPHLDGVEAGPVRIRGIEGIEELQKSGLLWATFRAQWPEQVDSLRTNVFNALIDKWEYDDTLLDRLRPFLPDFRTHAVFPVGRLEEALMSLSDRGRLAGDILNRSPRFAGLILRDLSDSPIDARGVEATLPDRVRARLRGAGQYAVLEADLAELVLPELDRQDTLWETAVREWPGAVAAFRNAHMPRDDDWVEELERSGRLAEWIERVLRERDWDLSIPAGIWRGWLSDLEHRDRLWVFVQEALPDVAEALRRETSVSPDDLIEEWEVHDTLLEQLRPFLTDEILFQIAPLGYVNGSTNLAIWSLPLGMRGAAVFSLSRTNPPTLIPTEERPRLHQVSSTGQADRTPAIGTVSETLSGRADRREQLYEIGASGRVQPVPWNRVLGPIAAPPPNGATLHRTWLGRMESRTRATVLVSVGAQVSELGFDGTWRLLGELGEPIGSVPRMVGEGSTSAGVTSGPNRGTWPMDAMPSQSGSTTLFRPPIPGRLPTGPPDLRGAARVSPDARGIRSVAALGDGRWLLAPAATNEPLHWMGDPVHPASWRFEVEDLTDALVLAEAIRQPTNAVSRWLRSLAPEEAALHRAKPLGTQGVLSMEATNALIESLNAVVLAERAPNAEVLEEVRRRTEARRRQDPDSRFFEPAGVGGLILEDGFPGALQFRRNRSRPVSGVGPLGVRSWTEAYLLRAGEVILMGRSEATLARVAADGSATLTRVPFLDLERRAWTIEVLAAAVRPQDQSLIVYARGSDPWDGMAMRLGGLWRLEANTAHPERPYFEWVDAAPDGPLERGARCFLAFTHNGMWLFDGRQLRRYDDAEGAISTGMTALPVPPQSDLLDLVEKRDGGLMAFDPGGTRSGRRHWSPGAEIDWRSWWSFSTPQEPRGLPGPADIVIGFEGRNAIGIAATDREQVAMALWPRGEAPAAETGWWVHLKPGQGLPDPPVVEMAAMAEDDGLWLWIAMQRAFVRCRLVAPSDAAGTGRIRDMRTVDVARMGRGLIAVAIRPDPDGRAAWLVVQPEPAVQVGVGAGLESAATVELRRWEPDVGRLSDPWPLPLAVEKGFKVGPSVPGRPPALMARDAAGTWTLWDPADWGEPGVQIEDHFFCALPRLEPAPDSSACRRVEWFLNDFDRRAGHWLWPLDFWRDTGEQLLIARLTMADGTTRIAVGSAPRLQSRLLRWTRLGVVMLVVAGTATGGIWWSHRWWWRRSSLQRRHNPYVVGPAVLEPVRCYGRDRLLRRLRDTLPSTNWALTGPFRIGKTTIQKQLERVLRTLDDPCYAFHPVFIDLQQFKPERDGFLAFLARNVMRGLEESGRVSKDAPGGLRLGALGATDPYDGIEFGQDMDRILGHLAEADPRRRPILVLQIDEIQLLAKVPYSLLSEFRSVLIPRDGLRTVLSGVQLVKNPALDSASPWWNIFREEPVGPLTLDEARRLVTQPVRGLFGFREEAVQRILSLTQCEPMRIQALCSDMLDERYRRGFSGFHFGEADVIRAWSRLREKELPEASLNHPPA